MASLIVSPKIDVTPTIPVGTVRPQIRTMGNVTGGFNPTTDFSASGGEPNFPIVERSPRRRNIFEIAPVTNTASPSQRTLSLIQQRRLARFRDKKFGRFWLSFLNRNERRITNVNYNREQPIGTTSMRYANSNSIAPTGIPADALTTPMGLKSVDASDAANLSFITQPLIWIAIGVFVLFGLTNK